MQARLLTEAQQALQVAQCHWNNAVCPDEIDAAHHELMAAEIRLNSTIRKMKEEMKR